MLPLNPLAATPASTALPDAGVTEQGGKQTCSISDDQLANLRAKALQLLGPAVRKGYQDFPIARKRFVAAVAERFITTEAICAALTGRTGATSANHNDLRAKYKSSSLSPRDARAHGMVAERVPVTVQCPEDYDWANSPVYTTADECSDVTGGADDGIGTLMYATEMTPEQAQRFLRQRANTPHYSRYASGGPVSCVGGKGYIEAYHSLYASPVWPNINFVMREFDWPGYSAWQLRRSCTAADGQSYEADDLMFDFGFRVFLPIDVEQGGAIAHQTLIISSVAAASSNPLAKLLPDSFPFHRFIGGEYAKKLLLEAKQQGWGIR